MRKPLAALMALAVAFGAPGASYGSDGTPDPGKPVPPVDAPVTAPPPPSLRSVPGTVVGPFAPEPLKPPPLKVEKDLAQQLGQSGFQVEPDGTMVHPESGAKFKPSVLRDMGLEWEKGGRLVFQTTKEPIESEKLMPLLKGMLGFSAVAQRDPADVGKQLQALGVPVSYNNIHLVNPDGTATYFGQMLYHGLLQGPEGEKLDSEALAKRLSGERLSQSLALFDSGFSEAFRNRRPDIGLADAKAGFELLSKPRAPTETPLKLTPGADIGAQVKGYQDAIDAAVKAGSKDPKDIAKLEEARRHLEALTAYRYHAGQSLSSLSPDKRPVPAPGAGGGGPGGGGPGLMPFAAIRNPFEAPKPPAARTLPMLLSMIDKLPGPPMTLAQKEAFIKSFPMGETVWSMGAHDLWKEGLKGEGVRVAVIDTGVSMHPELEGAVKARKNFTKQLDGDALGNHATHVAGTIHALAPSAEIRSYAALDADAFGPTGRVKMIGPEVDGAILRAIEQAVKDGNQVVNMSLGGRGRPSDEIAKKINEYSKQGVIFVVSAGNGGPFVGEVSSPSVAESAWTVGASNSEGRVTSFTSFGRNFDPETMSYVVKPVLVAPGDEVNSAVKPFMGTDGGWTYGRMSGTSMAAPHIAGATVLMVDAARKMNGLANPFEMSRRIQEAFVTTGRDVNRRELAPDVPADQRFIVVDPVAAHERLKAGQTLAKPPQSVPRRRPDSRPLGR